MFGWRFSWNNLTEVDLFTDRNETRSETLSQAIRAAASEDPDADGSVLFGHLRGTVVGLRYYTGVVSSQKHFSRSDIKLKRCTLRNLYSLDR